MAADRLTQAVRHQLGLGRLLPLGRAEDGAWLTEEATVAALRRAVAGRFPGVRLSGVRLDLSAPETAAESAVPHPPSALAVGPLTLDADVAVTAQEPLPALTESLRHALLAAAERELGLELKTVNLRVTELLEAPESPEHGDGPDATDAAPEATDEEGTARDEAPSGGSGDRAARVAAAVLAVPGVARLAPVLGSPLTLTASGTAARAVRITEAAGSAKAAETTETTETADTAAGAEGTAEATQTDPARDSGSAGSGTRAPRHVLLQLAVAPGHRALDVARAARGAAAGAAGDEGQPGQATVAVLVTGVGPA